MSAPAPRADSAPSRLASLLMLLLVVAVAWTFREVPRFGYATLMDDDTNILFNPHLGVIDGARLKWMFTDIDYVARYLPLGWLSFDIFVGADLSPEGCHLAGVCFHALNALLVFLCLQHLLARFASSSAAAERTLAAGVGALLWALHPLRVECVAWCSGLLYVQGGFFVLLSVYARLRELETRSAGAAGAWRWFVAGLAALVISLLTYPVALFLPAALLVLDYAWLKKENVAPPAGARRTLAWELAVIAALSALALAATLIARHVHIQNGLPPPTLAQFGLIPRAFQAAYVWASYVWRTLWPVGLVPVVEALFEIHLSDVRIWGALPTLLLISALAWRWRRSAPFFGAAWIAYLAFMVPVLGLTEHPHTAADRYSYLIGILFSLVVILGVLQLRSPAMRRGLFAWCGLVAVVYAAISVKQARLWRDAFTIHEYVLTRLHDADLRNITLVRMAKLQFLNGDVRGGRELAEKVYAASANIAGVARAWREMAPERPLTPEVAARRLQEWPAAPWACLHERIAAEQLREGRAHDALARLDAALALSPDFAEVRFQRALLYAVMGQPRDALHDWLMLRSTGAARTLAPGGLEFAADKIANAFDDAGGKELAAMLRRRKPPSSSAANGANSPLAP
jgi:hypothetical protein